MPREARYELDGVRLCDLQKNKDERGFFVELLRNDWSEFLGGNNIMQISLSVSLPGVVRAWHRHTRGQIDYLVVIKGSVKIVAYDELRGSSTYGKIAEILASEKQLQIVRIPGCYWHGTKNVGNKPSHLIYLMTSLYDYGDPDEDRRPWDDPRIIDTRTNQPYQW